MSLTDDPNDPALKQTRSDGQQEKYLVLSEEERKKGFVRPVRDTYKHVGRPAPKHPLRDLNENEKVDLNLGDIFVKFEVYPESESPKTGRYWTQEELDNVNKGCGHTTTMGRELAETYARSPGFYGKTFCCHCGDHLPVGEHGEFIWVDDGSRVGT